jgi:SAM-dependent methyltransferase
MSEQTSTVTPALTPRGAAWRGRLRRWLVPVFKPSRSVLLPSLWRAMLMRPIPFEIWFRLRAWRQIAAHGIRRLGEPGTDASRSFMTRVSTYNESKLWEFYRVRTEKFMALLQCIDARPKEPALLCIGPRNEAEILLLSLYGFPLRNITGVDLFSYSPRIRCMDMHRLEFADSSFDIVYSAWTLKYSYDLQAACREIVRVVRPGGLVVTGFSHTLSLSEVIGAPIAGGLSELLAAFSPHVDWIYWQESTPVGDDAEEVSVIFRVRKAES